MFPSSFQMYPRIAVRAVAAIVFLCIQLSAQDRSMVFERFTIENGLSNNSVNNILQTKDGFLWIATKDGLNRYDGQSFKYYKHDPSKNSLPENYVNVLLECSDGTLLIGMWGGGLCVYNSQQETFTRIDSPEPYDDYIQALYQDAQGYVWIGTLNGGLSKVDLKTKKIISYRKNTSTSKSFPTDNITCIINDQQNNLWLGSGDAGLLHFDPTTEKITYYTDHPSNNNKVLGKNILTIVNDRNTYLWIGTQAGFDRFDLSTGHWTHNPFVSQEHQAYLANPVSQIIKDRLGRLWVGTYEYLGLFQIESVDAPAPAVVHFRRENDNLTSIISDRIRWMYEDRQHNIWIGTEDGLAKLPVTQPFYQYRHLPLRPTSLNGRVVSGIVEDEDEVLWVGLGGSGFDKIDLRTKTIQHYSHDNQKITNTLSSNTVTSMYKDRDGILWVGTMSGGLNKFDPKTKTIKQYTYHERDSTSIRSNWVQQVLETRQGEFLVATNDGLQLFDRKRETFQLYRPPVVTGTKLLPATFSPNALFEDREGNIWIGTWLDGLFQYNPKTKMILQYLPEEKNLNSISSSKITSITEDKLGHIWIGTHSGGFNKFDKASEKFYHYSTLNGLPNDVVFGILEDDRGFVWVSTMKGLVKFNPKTETFRVYDESDGIVHNQFNWRAYFKNKKGAMYFGGINGFVAFHPDSMKIDSVPPNVAITSFKIFDKEVILPQSLTDTKEIVLHHDQNFFSIEFIVLDLTPLHKHQFAYMLNEVDPDWVNAGARRVAYYTNIEQGTYYFRVKANNADGVWGAPTILKIVILPAWWMTWWFRVLVFLSLLTGGIALYKYRVRQLIEIERIRFNIASDLHDEIGSNLSSISVDSQMLMQGTHLSDTERELSSDISKTAKETVEAMRDIIWFINPKNDIGEDVIFKMKETASKLLVGIQWTFNISSEIRFTAFDLEVRRHLFLMYKEWLTNVVRHSKAQHCDIEAGKKGNMIHLVIQDNGVGFDVQHVKKNNGLSNIYHRAEKIHAQVALTSDIGKGTRIVITIPIKAS